MKTFKIRVNPDVLAWARSSLNINLTQAAKSSGILADRLEQMEKGKILPSYSQLERMAKAYKRSVVTLLMSTVPTELNDPTDYRIDHTNADRKISTKTKIAIRKAKRVQLKANELEIEKDHPLKIPKITMRGNAESIAEDIRTAGSISLEKQFKWKDERHALRNWKSWIESQGILVLQYALPKNEVRGFSLSEIKPYTIVLNTGDYPRPRIFTLIHEYCHLLLRKEGLCDWRNVNINSRQGVEVFCNQFAASFLVPKSSLLSNSIVNHFQEEWSDDDLRHLANKYRVSAETILRRLVTLNFASEEFYKKKRKSWNEALAEKEAMDKKNKKPFVLPRPEQILNQNGLVYTNLVLELYHEGGLSLRDSADYLDTKPQYIKEIEGLAGSHV